MAKRATKGSVTVHIDAPPEAVYALVSDVTRMGEWSPETVRCEWLDGASGPAVGARFKAWNKHGILRWSNKPEVIAAEPGREFAFTRVAAGSEVVWRYRFEPAAGGGTDATESFEVVKPTSKVVDVVLDFVMRTDDRDADLTRGMRETLERVKAAAESAPSRG